MLTRRWVLFGALLLGGLAALGGQAFALASGRDSHDAIQIFNRDVYFLDHVTLRNPTADTEGSAQLYSDAGAALPVTWREWQAASANSTVVTTGGDSPQTLVFISFTGLIPHGVYSVFYGTLGPDSEHPDCQGVERTLPITSFGQSARGPDASSFVADESGKATYTGKIEGDLLSATQAFFSIIYHFNEMTYHPFPNAGEALTHDSEFGCRSSYGHDAMRQLIIFQKF